MSTSLAERPASLPASPAVTPDQLDLIRRTIAKDATPDELKLYLYDCARQGVHPLDKLIHFTKRSGKYTPITSIDFMRIRAADTGEYAGSDTALFAGEDGVWSSLWIAGQPLAAMVTVWRIVQGQRCKFDAVARWSEYKPDQNDFMWRKMPATMLGKCAEALALRKGFPRQLAGLYAKEEMDQAGASQESDGYEVTAPAAKGEGRENSSAPNEGNSGTIPLLPPGHVLIARVGKSRAGAVGEIWFLGDPVGYLFYTPKMRPQAEQACQDRIPVMVDFAKSSSGNKYIKGLTPLPQPISDAELDAELLRQDQAKKAGEVF